MNKKELFLSVIIPTYNSALTLIKCIDSVINQNFDNYEIIVVDDGSTDKTYEVISKIKNKIKYYKLNHKGVSNARNFGLKKSLGKFVTFVDSDDYIEQNYFNNFKNIVDNNDIDIYLCGINIVKEDVVLKRNAKINGKF